MDLMMKEVIGDSELGGVLNEEMINSIVKEVEIDEEQMKEMMDLFKDAETKYEMEEALQEYMEKELE